MNPDIFCSVFLICIFFLPLSYMIKLTLNMTHTANQGAFEILLSIFKH